MTQSEFSELAAAFALGALTTAERAAFERALSEHPEWADLVDADLGTVSELAGSTSPEAPRPEVRARVMAQLDALIAAGEPPSAMRIDVPGPSPVSPRSPALKPQFPGAFYCLRREIS